MQLAAINATQAQFEASLGIETFDDLCNVLSYLSENEELIRQMCEAYKEVLPNAMFCKQFNHVFLDSEKAFGKYYSKLAIDQIMERMRAYVVPHKSVTGFGDFDINFSAIKRLAGMGVNVAVDFVGGVETDDEADTLTLVYVTFNVVQYAAPFVIQC